MKKLLIYFSIIMFLSISCVGCSNKNNDMETIKEKMKSELAYLDSNLISMLNEANGISLENYIVQAEKIEENGNSEGGNNSGSSNSSSSSESSGSEADSTNEGGTDSQTTSKSSSNNVNYKMVGNEILLQEKKTNWDSLKSNVEKLYADWENIMLDLYKLNINNQDILSFNTNLDNATNAIKSEDKIKTLNSLAVLYSYIPKYMSIFSNSTKMNNLYSTKSNVLNAYISVEQDNFSRINEELKSAETTFMSILNDMNSDSMTNQSNINRAYVLIKELQNYNANTGKDVFYIKYKNLIQNLNNITV